MTLIKNIFQYLWQSRITFFVMGSLSTLTLLSLGVSLGTTEGSTLGWVSDFSQNFSTEMIGAVLTFGLFGLAERTRSTANYQKTLIRNARSRVPGVTVQAIEELREHGWLVGKKGLLKGANLLGAILTGAPLYNANLAGASLEFANLTEADLRGAILTGADLREANLTGANLLDANLTGASLWGATLTGAKLLGATLENVLWQVEIFGIVTTLPDGTKWTEDTDMGRFTDGNHPEYSATRDKIKTIRKEMGLDPIQ